MKEPKSWRKIQLANYTALIWPWQQDWSRVQLNIYIANNQRYGPWKLSCYITDNICSVVK